MTQIGSNRERSLDFIMNFVDKSRLLAMFLRCINISKWKNKNPQNI